MQNPRLIPTAADSTASSAAATHRRPVIRRHHTKSRRGCLNCKRRKVKCGEEAGTCSHCRRLGLTCEYPSTRQTPDPAVALQPNSLIFSLEDLRFFHHFITIAHPLLPLGDVHIWKKTAAISYNYGYLAHSLLGSAASHLTHCTNVDYSSQALSHRVKAINLVNEKLSKLCPDQSEGDAIFATLMLLTNQAYFMQDAMLEYVTMLRGCALVGGAIMPNPQDSEFSSLTQEQHIERVQSLVRARVADPAKEGFFGDFIKSLILIAPLCKTPFEHKYLATLRRIAEAASIAAVNAWPELTIIYTLPSTIPNDEFADFTRPDNYVAQLLLIHMFLLDCFFGEYIMQGPQRNVWHVRQKIMASWVESVAQNLPRSYTECIKWPSMFGRALLKREALLSGGSDRKPPGEPAADTPS